MTGAPLLPGPGSYLEQDAELILAFELLEGIWREMEQVREELKKARQKNEELLASGQVPLPTVTR